MRILFWYGLYRIRKILYFSIKSQSSTLPPQKKIFQHKILLRQPSNIYYQIKIFIWFPKSQLGREGNFQEGYEKRCLPKSQYILTILSFKNRKNSCHYLTVYLPKTPV